MQKRHNRFDLVVRLATHAIHLLDRDGGTVRERIVRPPLDVLARFGDPTPVQSDPDGRSPKDIVTDALAEVVDDSLTDRRVLALVPDHWGPHRRDLVTALLTEWGATVKVCPETDFLLEHRDDAPAGGDHALWVRMGSELTTASLVHRHHDRWIHAHRVETTWGGDDIDDQLAGFVSHRLPESSSAEDLRTGCREARERLSGQVTAGVTTSSGGVHVHRKDVEELAEPSARAALTSTLGQVLALSEETTTSVLISGGTARMPLIAQLASEIAGRPVRLIDWRDAVEAILDRPAVIPVVAASDDAPALVPAHRRTTRRRTSFLAAAAVGGLAVLVFAVAAATQTGGSAGLMRIMLGEGQSGAPGGPPGAYAAPNTEDSLSGFSTTAPGAVPTSSGSADAVELEPGQSAAAPTAPGSLPTAPGAPATVSADGTTSLAASAASGAPAPAPAVPGVPAPALVQPPAAQPPAPSAAEPKVAATAAPPPAPVTTTAPPPAPATTEAPPPVPDEPAAVEEAPATPRSAPPEPAEQSSEESAPPADSAPATVEAPAPTSEGPASEAPTPATQEPAPATDEAPATGGAPTP